VIADIGCGIGGLEVALLERSFAFGTLYAIEVDEHALEFMTWMLNETDLPGRERIQPMHTRGDDIGLAEETIDVAVLLNTPIYSPETGRRTMSQEGENCLASIRRALKPGGRLEVFDDNTGFTPSPDDPHHCWAEFIEAA
jgi:SAM-dependent methyltransferase